MKPSATGESLSGSIPLEPSESALKRSHALAALIRAEIKAARQSAIPFQRFMELALYTAALGYYQSDAPKFGEAGDFITAPEISSLFSRCVARQAQQVLAELGQGDILEVGAGSGTMAVDLLQALQDTGHLPTKYLILEQSPALRHLQQATIKTRAPSLFSRFEWLDNLPASGFQGVILANELLDAMPTSRFFIQDGAVWEWMVGWAEEQFAWQLAPARAGVEQAVRHIEKSLGESLPDEYSSEVHPAQAAWIGEIARRMDAGLLLLLDYGYPRAEYYHPKRYSGTLKCHYRHRLHDNPLFLPGLQDISVHVDFSAIAEAGIAETLQLAGFTTQRDFLIAMGLLEMCAQIDPMSIEYMTLAQEIKRLVLPGEMGDMVKVMGLVRGLRRQPQGFSGIDLRGRL
uniref:SAM-dependent methyltransferase, MidA family n=1 Tax=Candidatus Kentrum sp. TUN TaxID=2126343 RepID=A0A450ZMC7_9GAMM|nr:MAG: SAM-dependent methyltransferase, MidA family [Candidatus Kentron sp. TUN]VFK54975.1 MAG: SAM-dependent methyltransferase, MidA family [Candidatus Kentron sp. TUN]